MMPVKQPSIGHKVHPNHGPKVGPLELPGDHKLSLLETQTQESSRFPVNHCKYYIYITSDTIIPVNNSKHYTYINTSAELPVNHSKHYTYTADCARCAINSRQSQNLQHPYSTQKTPPNPSPASLRGPRLSKQTLSFNLPLITATSPHTSTPDFDAKPYHSPKRSKPHSSKPPVHMEQW
jgi:hypothetical protein